MFLVKLIYIFASLASVGAVAYDGSATIANDPIVAFQNYSQTVELTPASQHGVYSSNTGLTFFLSYKILAQISKSNKIKLDNLDGVQRTQILAELSNSDIVLVTPKENTFHSIYKNIQALEGVLRVQPDFALVKEKHKELLEKVKNLKVDKIQLSEFRNLQCKTSPVPKRIAIIDDGYDFSRSLLSPLNVVLEYDADKREIGPAPNASGNEHGDMVAGVIATQLKSKSPSDNKRLGEIVAIRQKSTLNSSMILAFSISQKMNVNIINSSWTLPFVSELLAEVIENAISEGEVGFVIVSAGNHGQDACNENKLTTVKGVTAVGAHTENGYVASFSNYGRCVDLYAPANFSIKHKETYLRAAGTSSAAAMVSGEFSYLLGCGLSNKEIRAMYNNN